MPYALPLPASGTTASASQRAPTRKEWDELIALTPYAQPATGTVARATQPGYSMPAYGTTAYSSTPEREAEIDRQLPVDADLQRRENVATFLREKNFEPQSLSALTSAYGTALRTGQDPLQAIDGLLQTMPMQLAAQKGRSPLGNVFESIKNIPSELMGGESYLARNSERGVTGGPVGGIQRGEASGSDIIARAAGVEHPDGMLGSVLREVTHPGNLIGLEGASAVRNVASIVSSGIAGEGVRQGVAQVTDNEYAQFGGSLAGGLGGGMAPMLGNKRGVADAPMQPEAPSFNDTAINNYLAAASPMRVKGEIDPHLVDVEAKEMYSGSIDQVAVKELLQNSIDATRGNGGNIDINYEADARRIVITDEGTGMAPRTLMTKFINPGGSLKPDGSTGGFGRAKIAYMGNAESINVETTALVDGKYVTSTLRGGSLRDILVDGADVETTRTADTGKTGTRVEIVLKADTRRDPSATALWNSRFSKYSMLPGNIKVNTSINIISDTFGNAAPELREFGDPLELMDGAVTTRTYMGTETIKSSQVEVHILNNGMYQFSTKFFLGQDMPVPEQIVVNVRANQPPGSGNYPFKLDREGLDDRVRSAIDDGIIKNIRNAGASVVIKEMRDALVNAPKVGGGYLHRVVDTTGQFTSEYLHEVGNKPYLRTLLPLLDRYRARWSTSVKAMYPDARDSQFYGWSVGPGARGLHVYSDVVMGDPRMQGRRPRSTAEVEAELNYYNSLADNATGEDAKHYNRVVDELEIELEASRQPRMPDPILYNPYRIMDAALDWSAKLDTDFDVFDGNNQRPTTTAKIRDRLAGQFAAVIAHESLHDAIHNDDQPFSVALTDLVANNAELVKTTANALRHALNDVDLEGWINDTTDYERRVNALGNSRRNILERASDEFRDEASGLDDRGARRDRRVWDELEGAVGGRDGRVQMAGQEVGATGSPQVGGRTAKRGTEGSRRRTSQLPERVAARIDDAAEAIRARVGELPPGDHPELAVRTGGGGRLGNQSLANWGELLDVGFSEMPARAQYDAPQDTGLGLRSRFKPFTDVDDHAIDFRYRGHTVGLTQLPNSVYDMSIGRDSARNMQGRNPEGSDPEGMSGVGSIITDLLENNPDALFAAWPTDARRAKIYTLAGFRPPTDAEFKRITGFEATKHAREMAGEPIVLDRAKFRKDKGLAARELGDPDWASASDASDPMWELAYERAAQARDEARWAAPLDTAHNVLDSLGFSEMRAYHGTSYAFKGLPSGARGGRNSRYSEHGVVYYTTDTELANWHAEVKHRGKSARVIPVEVDAKLFDPSADKWPAGFDDARDYWKINKDDETSFLDTLTKEERGAFIDELRAQGYDGVHSNIELAVWNQSKVKPAYREQAGDLDVGFSRMVDDAEMDEDMSLMRRIQEIFDEEGPLEGDYIEPLHDDASSAGGGGNQPPPPRGSTRFFDPRDPDPIGDIADLIPGTVPLEPVRDVQELGQFAHRENKPNRVDLARALPRHLLQLGQAFMAKYQGELRNYQSETSQRVNAWTENLKRDKAAYALIRNYPIEADDPIIGKVDKKYYAFYKIVDAIEKGTIADLPHALREHADELRSYRDFIEARDVQYKAEWGTPFLRRSVTMHEPTGDAVSTDRAEFITPEDTARDDGGWTDILISEYFPALFKEPKGGWDTWLRRMTGRSAPGTREFQQKRRTRVVDDPETGGVRAAEGDEIGRPRSVTEAMRDFGLEPIDSNPAVLLAMRDWAGMRRIQKDMLLQRLKRGGVAARVIKPSNGPWHPPEGIAQWEVSGVAGFDWRRISDANVDEGWAMPRALKTLVDDTFDVNAGMTYRQGIRAVVSPIIAVKLWGFIASVFQHLDIGIWRDTTHHIAMALGDITPTRANPLAPVTGLPKATMRIAQIGPAWIENAVAAAVPRYRRHLQREWTEHPTLSLLVRNGANVSAVQEFVSTQLTNEVQHLKRFPFIGGLEDSSIGVLRVPVSALNALQSYMVEGLFEGLYLSASKHMALGMWESQRAKNPTWTDQQVALSVADNLNTLMSSIENWQSVIRNEGVRDISRGLLISFNEQEGMGRGFTRGLGALYSAVERMPGAGAAMRTAGRVLDPIVPQGIKDRVTTIAENTGRTPAARDMEGYWARFWIGHTITTFLLANVINLAVTGELLGKDQLSPVRIKDGAVKFNTRFFRPIVGFTEEGQPVFMDLWGQMDTPLRWLTDPVITANNRLTQGAKFMGGLMADAQYEFLDPRSRGNPYINMAKHAQSKGLEAITPISAENFKEGNDFDDTGLFAATVAGLNITTGGVQDVRNIEAKKLGYDSYNAAPPAMQERIDKLPNIKELQRQQREYHLKTGDSFSTNVENLRAQTEQEALDIESLYKQGGYLTNPNEPKLPEKFKELALKRLGQREAIEEVFAKTIAGFNRQQADRDLDAYFAVLTRTLDDTPWAAAGSVNWQDTIVKREAFLAGMSPDRRRDLEAMLDVIEGRRTPVYQAFRADMKRLDEMAYPFGTIATTSFQENNVEADLIMWRWYGSSLNTTGAVDRALADQRNSPMPIKLARFPRRIDTDLEMWQRSRPAIDYYMRLDPKFRTRALKKYADVNATLVYWGYGDRLHTPQSAQILSSYASKAKPAVSAKTVEAATYYMKLSEKHRPIALTQYAELDAELAVWHEVMYGRRPVLHSAEARAHYERLTGRPANAIPIIPIG